MRELARYWATDYDWRKGEAKLNAHPQFMTRIDGLDIHFIHVRSHHANATPLIIAHGWPGSVFEQIKRIGPLTDPVPGVPESHCVDDGERPPDAPKTGIPRFACLVAVDRYVASVSAEQLDDTQQRVAAQYVMLTAK